MSAYTYIYIYVKSAILLQLELLRITSSDRGNSFHVIQPSNPKTLQRSLTTLNSPSHFPSDRLKTGRESGREERRGRLLRHSGRSRVRTAGQLAKTDLADLVGDGGESAGRQTTVGTATHERREWRYAWIRWCGLPFAIVRAAYGSSVARAAQPQKGSLHHRRERTESLLSGCMKP